MLWHIPEILRRLRDVENKIIALESGLDKISAIPLPSGDFIVRLEDLELWRKRIHDVILDKTPSGKDKATRFGKELGRRFGGQSKHCIQ